MYQQHPLSAAFPAMGADEFQAMRDSIMLIGVQNPITLFEGMVIDGWHRYCAATEMGMDCPEIVLGDVDPREFVLAQNKARRHITQAQLIASASSVYQWRPNGGDHSALSAECISSKDLAAKVGAGIRSVEQFRQVEREAEPEVVEAVKRGEIGLPKASAISKLPPEQQAAAIHKPAPKPPATAKSAPAAPAPAPAPALEPTEPPAPEYTELDAARDQIADLQAALALASLGDIPESDRTQAAELIQQLQGEVKGLSAQLRAVTSSRDFLMQENTQMKQQLAAQRREIERLKAGAA